MSNRFWTHALRENWYLAVALVLCVGAFAYKWTTSSGPAEEPAPSPNVTAIAARQGFEELQRAQRTPRDTVMETIREHQAKIEAEPGSEDTPALMTAIGNLYRHKLGDERQAAQYYETVLLDHPDYPNARAVYIQLASCYEQLNETENAMRVYRTMMEKFEEDTQEYQFARSMLNGESVPAQ